MLYLGETEVERGEFAKAARIFASIEVCTNYSTLATIGANLAYHKIPNKHTPATSSREDCQSTVTKPMFLSNMDIRQPYYEWNNEIVMMEIPMVPIERIGEYIDG